MPTEDEIVATDAWLSRVEAARGITLPATYRGLMLALQKQFAAALWSPFGDLQKYNYLERSLPHTEAGLLAAQAEAHRIADAATPSWEREYFVIGFTNWDTCRAVRLDGTPGIFEFGEQPPAPSEYHETLADFIAHALAKYERDKDQTQPLHLHLRPFAPPAPREFLPSAAERPFLAAVIADYDSDIPRREYADWLAANDQTVRADFIRARLVLDGGPPAFGTHVDALERLDSAAAAAGRMPEYEPWLPLPVLPAGYRFGVSSTEQGLILFNEYHHRGFPSHADFEGIDGPHEQTIAFHVAQFKTLLAGTTVRGLDFGYDPAAQYEGFIRHPEFKKLRHLRAFVGDTATPGATIIDRLAVTDLPATLETLDTGVEEDSQLPYFFATLAAMPFRRLRQIDVHNSVLAAGALPMLQSEWFRNLQTVEIQERDDSPHTIADIGPMLRLHTLELWSLKEKNLACLPGWQVPSLRWLTLALDIDAHAARSLSELACGPLVALDLRQYGTCPPECLTMLLTSPWAAKLEVFQWISEPFTMAHAEALLAAPCAATLRYVKFDDCIDDAAASLLHNGRLPRLTTFSRPAVIEDDPDET